MSRWPCGTRTFARVLGLAIVTCLLAACAWFDDGTPVILNWGEENAAAASSGGASRPATRPGFLGDDGRSFTLDGRAAPLVGLNIYNAASTGNCWYDMRSQLAGTLDTISTETGGAANVIRVWFFQSLATVDGRRDWSALDRVLATARSRGFMVIPVLTDQWGACEGRGGSSGNYKDVTWYERGYREPDPGGTVSYRKWAQEVVGRYRDDPTVALWSLVNEAEARVRRFGECPPGADEALLAFTEDMAAAIKAVDPDHLLGLGTIGGGQCGTAAGDYQRLHASPNIDVCEYHDYEIPAMPGDERNGLQTRLTECAALDKPLFVGESGVVNGEVGGVDGRAEIYRAKLTAQIPAGVAGFLAWGWSATGSAADNNYGIGPGDPSLPVIGRYGRAAPESASVAARNPPMGFRYDTRFTGSMDEATVRELVDAVVDNGLAAAGYEYFLIDEGWVAARDTDGTLRAVVGFPGGIAAIADLLHARGLKLGLHATPAERTCGGGPGSVGAVARDVATFARWGVDLINLDWCATDSSPDAARAVAQQWRDAITATGREMLLAVNAGPRPDVGAWASRVATSWRTTNETCASWFNRTAPHASDARDCYDTEYFDGIYDVLTSGTARNAIHVGPGRWADAGGLEAGNPGLTLEEARTQFALWAMWSAPLVAGHDPRTMDGSDVASQVLLNREVIAVARDPLGRMATLVTDDDGMQVWRKHLGDGGRRCCCSTPRRTPGTSASTCPRSGSGVRTRSSTCGPAASSARTPGLSPSGRSPRTPRCCCAWSSQNRNRQLCRCRAIKAPPALTHHGALPPPELGRIPPAVRFSCAIIGDV